MCQGFRVNVGMRVRIFLKQHLCQEIVTLLVLKADGIGRTQPHDVPHISSHTTSQYFLRALKCR
jgi:hypothetical protein